MTENLTAALVAFQAAMPKLVKSSMADTGKYSYRYVALDDIIDTAEPILAANGLAFTCGPDLRGDNFGLVWRLMHVSGEALDGFLPMPPNAPPQTLGGVISYYRRYSMCAVLNIAADEDDDGQRAQDAWESARPAARASSGTRGSGRSRTAETPADPPEPDLRTEAQSRRMFMLLNQGGIKDRDEVLAFISELVARTVDSTRTLTREECGLVIASLEAAAAEKAGHDDGP